jgi:hypothetical protein
MTKIQFRTTENGNSMHEALTELVINSTKQGVTANEQINILAMSAALLIAQIDDGRYRKLAQDYLGNRTRVFVREFRKEGAGGAVVIDVDSLQ